MGSHSTQPQPKNSTASIVLAIVVVAMLVAVILGYAWDNRATDTAPTNPDVPTPRAFELSGTTVYGVPTYLMAVPAMAPIGLPLYLLRKRT